MTDNYWLRRQGLSRRQLLQGAGAAGIGALLASCGGSSKNNATAGGSPTAQAGSRAGTAAAGSAGNPVRGGTLTSGLAQDIFHFDPLKSTAYVDRIFYYQMFDSLLSTNKDLKLLPGLALSWETSDPLSVVFKLRQGVKFHDGADFDAPAVKFNLDRILQTQASPRHSEVASVDSVQVVDPSTVKLVLKSPSSPLLAQLVDRSGMILSPAAVQKLGDAFDHGPVGAGTGPFKFVDYKAADQISMARNESYWGKDPSGAALPYLDKLVFRPLPDETQRLNSLRTGEIDFASTVPSKDVEAVKKDASLIYVQIPSLSWNGVELNSSGDVFKDVRVRQALAWAIDRQQIIDTVFYKIPSLASGPISPAQFPYDAAYHPYPRDIAKAKALLQQAGKPSPTFTYLAYAGSPAEQQFAELIKDQVKDAGFTMNIQTLEGAAIASLQQKHQFDAISYFWSGRLDPDGNTYGQLHSSGGFNDGLYTNATMDKALDDGRVTFDQEKRKQLYQQVDHLAAEEAPWIFIYYGTTGQSSTTKVKHFTPVPDAIFRFVDVWKA